MRKAMILGGALALAAPLALASTPASAAAPTDSTRGDVIPCAIPHVPGPATVLGSGRKQGAVYRKYSITGTSPLQVGLYYLRNLPRRGYQIQAWGGGGFNIGKFAGSGFGVIAHAKPCGYVAIAAGSLLNSPTYLEVCTSRTQAALKNCSTSRSVVPKSTQ